MTEVKVSLNSVEKVKNFVNIMMKQEDNYDLISSMHYVIDAKSIMGIFSLDLSKPLTFKRADHSELDENILADIKDYIIQ